MSDLVPASAPVPLGNARAVDGQRPAILQQISGFAAQPAVKRTLPYAAAVGVLGSAALAWMVLSPAPQRVLYSELADGEKASVTQALDKASIPYKLDPATGAITVGEGDIYRARMMVASDGAVAAPSSGTDLIDSMPIGASRSVEAERLRAARERELQLTIMEIDGVESVRVHLAQAEKSVFVRDNSPPRASVMLKLARGRQLSDGQVTAIVNLVTGSVPGLSNDEVKVIDQHGRLVSDRNAGNANIDRLNMQSRMEEKLRGQLSQLLTPMFGEGNFSTEIQVDLDMNAVTSARESWNKDGAVRTETTQSSPVPENPIGYGVPGVLSNTPPPPTQVVPGAPGAPAKPAVQTVGGAAPATPATGAAAPAAGQTPATPPAPELSQSATRTYELGREVAVSNGTPGDIKRLSVAVVLSSAAMASRKPADIAQIKSLVGAAVGANVQRGDQVEVIARKFQSEPVVVPPFYEQPWFATVLRNGVALICVLLLIFFGLRPAIAAMRRKSEGKPGGNVEGDGPRALAANGDAENGDAGAAATLSTEAMLTERLDRMKLADQVGLAQRFISEQPDSAMAAIRQMLAEAESAKADAA
ncbi:MAG: flagellar basal-body MS-ring/collar protein FliF [Sphingobium sp.]